MTLKQEIRSNAASVAKVDMKLEVVIIPVSDVDRAKDFYKRLGWRLDVFAAHRGPVHAAGLVVLGSIREEPHVGRARFGQELPDRYRHHGRSGEAGRRWH
jgi:catechol 2,3-dioxygenase-like lactoylglutathione lyase family enzyme